MKKSVFVILILLVSLPVLGGSKAYDLLGYMPEDAIFAIASSGLDNMSDEFEQTFLSQVINDSQTKSFYNQFLSIIIQQQGQEFQQVYDTVTVVLKEIFESRIISGPMTAGLVLGELNTETPDFYSYLALTGGKAKAEQILNQINFQLSKFGVQDKFKYDTATISGYEVSHIDFSEGGLDLSFAWWVKGDFVLVTLETGYALDDFVPKLSKVFSAKADNKGLLSNINQYSDGSDDILYYLNGEKYVETMMSMTPFTASSFDNKTLDAMRGTMEYGANVCRLGFRGKQFIFDSYGTLGEDTEKQTYITLMFDDIDFSKVNMISSDMTGFSIVDIDIEATLSYFDNILSKLPEGNGEPANLAAVWKEVEDETGFDIKSNIIDNISGECLLTWKLDQQSGVVGSNVSIVAGIRNRQVVLQKIDKFLAGVPVSENYSLEASDVGDVAYRKLNIPSVSFLGVKPTLALCENYIVISTSEISANSLASRITSGAGIDGSIASTAKYKAAVKSMPEAVKVITYNDSESFWNGLSMIARSYYPLAVLGASQSGVKLPPMLPDYRNITKDMPSYISWLEASGVTVHQHCESELSNELVAVGGTALGVSILMPALSRARTVAKTTVNQANLKGIGVACVIYANENSGRMPQTLDDLKKVDLYEESLVCAHCGEHYTYVGKGLDDTAGNNMILAFSDCMGADPGYQIVYADGHVRQADADSFIEDIIENNAERAEIGLPEINMDEIYYSDEMTLADYNEYWDDEYEYDEDYDGSVITEF